MDLIRAQQLEGLACADCGADAEDAGPMVPAELIDGHQTFRCLGCVEGERLDRLEEEARELREMLDVDSRLDAIEERLVTTGQGIERLEAMAARLIESLKGSSSRIAELEELLRDIHPHADEDIQVTIEGTLGAEPRKIWVPTGERA